MSRRKLMNKIKLPVLALLVILFGCSSPLLEEIQEEVEVIQTPPSIVSVYPKADTTSVSIDDDIQIVFTKNIQSSSITGGTFIIEDEYGDRTTGSYTVSSDTVTFSPNKLYYDTVYTITATSGILDSDGNSFSSDYTWIFTTQAAPASVKPVFQDFNINNGKSATSETDIELGFLATDYLGSTSGLEARYKLSDEDDWSDWQSMDNGFVNIPVSLTITVPDGEDEDFDFEAEVRDGDKVVSQEKTATITYKTSTPSIDDDQSYPAPDSTDSPGNLAYAKIAFDSEMDTGTITSETVYISQGTTQITTFEFEFTDDKKGVEFTVFDDGGGSYEFEAYTDYTVFISSEVSDVAGNSFGSDYSYTFRTDGIDDVTAPTGVVALDVSNADINATNVNSFDLQIQAIDDYNNVRAVKVWGDNNLGMPTLPIFESEASWLLYSEIDPDGPDNIPGNADDQDYMSYFLETTNNWQVPNTDQDYFIYYRFIDFANNETQTPGILRLSLDGTPPTFYNIQINDGSGFTNNADGVVNIILDADDIHSGLEAYWISSESALTETLPGSNSGSWNNWAALITDYSLPADGEGKYFIYGQVRDFVGNLSGVISSSVIVDTTAPLVDFDGIEMLEVNSLAYQDVNVSDPDPGGSDYQIPSEIATYSWEQLSGPGTLTFYEDSGGSTVNSEIDYPYIKAGASDGSEDGMYEVLVTVTDNAGNESFNTTNFIWDTIDPDNIGTISAFNDDGSSLTTSSNGTMVYTPSAQPYATWPSSDGADFYIIVPWFELFDPNTDPGVPNGDPAWYPHWDDDEVDWDDPLTFEDKNYIYQESPFVSAPPPSSPGNNDGPVYLYVSAWDRAGNRSNRLSDKLVRFHIDTLPPVVNVLNDLPQSNSTVSIDFHTSDDLGDGRVYDQRTADDPTPGTDGSGIASYLWAQESGPGTLTIQNPTTLTPSVYGVSNGSEDGEYVLRLTATDQSGNEGLGFISLIWDTTDPDPVSVIGPDRTPDLTPTWSWTTGGGGNGTFEYQLETSGGSVVTSWTSTTDTYFTPGSNLTNDVTYVLYVREYDDAGNFSDSSISQSNHSIWVDQSYKTEPTVTLSGSYLRNATELSVTWSMGSGIGEPASEYYRYWIENSSGSAVMYGSGASANVIGPFGSGAASETVDLSALADGVYYIKVQEYDSVNYTYPDSAGWTSTDSYIGESSAQTDATAPNAPVNYLYNTGYNITSNGYHLTNDTTPYLRWSSGGGGNGNYRWSLDESSWTYTTSIYVYPNMPEGVYTFYVQERDTAGNWSVSETYNLEVDTTAPTLTSILLENRSTNASNTTSYAVSPYVDINVTSSGSNDTTYPGGDIRRMVFWNSGGTEYTYYVSGNSVTFLNWFFGTNGGSTTDGTKYVYCKLIDYAGNESVVRSDGIILDTVAPSVTNFSINNGATTATSQGVTLYSTLTADAYAMRISNDGGSTWSGWYGDSTAKSWNLTSGYGAKEVLVQYTDAAGYFCRNTSTNLAAHDTDVNDAIFYGTPQIDLAYKGYTNNGYIRVYYDAYPSETGSTNTYEVYYATSPTGGKTLKGSTTSSSYYAAYYTEGTPYYFFVRVYNPEIGYTNYSSYAFGFSSDIAIVYDDDDSNDTILASAVKGRITTDWVSASSNVYNQGSYTWEEYTATLVPEDEIPTYFYTEETTYKYHSTVIHGDPVIITPSAAAAYSDVNKARNIAESGHGVIGMHYAGWRFMQTVVNNWSSWGFPTGNTNGSNTPPTGIDYAYSRGDTQYAGTKEYYSQYEYIWHKYMYYSVLYNSSNVNNPNYNALMFTSNTDPSYAYGMAHRWSIYSTAASGGSATNALTFYADDPDSANYYSIARHGRFVYWGYNKMPGYYYGIPLLYNITKRLNDGF